MKQQVKGMLAGFILCAMLSTSVMVIANTQTINREIAYGINVMLNGEMVRFDDESRPFVMEGRTFLPLRTISELLGLPVDFDPATNTAIVGNRFLAGTRLPLNQIAPHFDGRAPEHGGLRGSLTTGNVEMGGRTFNNAVIYHSRPWHGDGTNFFTAHNLDGQYRMLTGHIGRIDNSSLVNATVRFLGDGVELATYELRAGDLPTEISVFVEGIHLLRVEIVVPNTSYRLGSAANIRFALVGYLE